ncbi:MAG: peptidoglycan-binding domain-containing protein [Pseudomonadota bacterium]
MDERCAEWAGTSQSNVKRAQRGGLRRAGAALAVAMAATLGSLVAVPGTAGAQEARIVALIVSTGDGGARADAVQASLQVMGAETLRSIDANNAQMRSVLARFADAAVETDVALVYIDAPVVALDGRPFVLPANTRLNRRTDLFTRALPLSAFARAAADAGAGGAVMVAVNAAPALPEGLSLAETAPQARTGAAPVVLARRGQSDPILRALSAAGRAETVILGELIATMAEGSGVELSGQTVGEVFLRRPVLPDAEPEPEEPVVVAVVPTAAEVEAVGDQTDLAVLELIEQSMSRAAKRELQRGLSQRGHYQGFIDGIFGVQTRGAIESFQRALGHPVTGYLTTDQIADLR